MVSQTIETLLEYVILPVPKGKRNTEPLVVIRHTGKTVLAPSVGPGSCMVVWEEAPGVSVPTVILTHRRLFVAKK